MNRYMRKQKRRIYNKKYRKFISSKLSKLKHLSWSQYKYNPQKIFRKFEKEFHYKFNRIEEQYRRKIFDRNVKKILSHNKYHNDYRMSINQFSILTDKEFSKKYLSNQLPIKTRERKLFFDEDVDDILNKMPAKLNWKEQGKISDIKNQNNCFSCYSFSAVAAIEAGIKINYDIDIILSEQEIIDCSKEYNNFGCEGGQPEFVYDYIIKEGITTEKFYPFIGKTSECKKNPSAVKLKILTGYKKPEHNVISLLEYLQKGPVVVNHFVPDDFKYYSSGIFDTPDCYHQIMINHSSIVVGYNFSGNTPYFILKNSWGQKWGDYGYYKVKIGPLNKNNPGFCFLASNGYNVFPEILIEQLIIKIYTI